MQEPILAIANDNGDHIDVFRSIDEARSYIEPYDVDLWEVFTADGFVIEVTAVGMTKSFWSISNPNTCLKLTETNASERLKDKVVKFLALIGKHPNPDMTLPDLIELMKPFKYS